MTNLPRSLELLSRRNSRVALIDLQEKFVPHIPVAGPLIAQCRRLLRGAELLGIPAAATEQYPQGLGPTVSALKPFFSQIPEKQRFSSAEVLGWGTAAEQGDDRFQVVLCGIESHVCVLQTAFDLSAAGFQVFIPADAVASRRKSDWKHGLDRMRDAGITVTTVESVLFEWCETAAAPEFRALQKIIKEEDALIPAS